MVFYYMWFDILNLNGKIMRLRKKFEREVDEDLVIRMSWVNVELVYKYVKKVS